MTSLNLPQNGAVESLSIRLGNCSTGNKHLPAGAGIGTPSVIAEAQNLSRSVDSLSSSLSMSSSSTPSPTRLLDLPNEILVQIFQCLAGPRPSHVKALGKPEHDLTSSTLRPLKNLSLGSSRSRSLVLPLLFRHARLDPYHVLAFLTFAASSDTARHMKTVAAKLQGPCSHIHPAWWSMLINRLPNLTTIIVLAAPHVFAEIGQVPVETSHNWAFKIPYHTMTLTCDRSPLSPPESIADAGDGHNLLTVRSWTHLSINESSHLPAYSTYEYFLKTPPSLLMSLNYQYVGRARSQDVVQRPSPGPTTLFFDNILSFNYTAIFPFYNHVDEILKCVRRMKNLKRLFMKLCPEPESNVLQDELDRNGANAGRIEGRIDVNDPWNEFETSYTLIPQTLIFLTNHGSLEEFQTDDVKMSGIRETLIDGISRRLAETGGWTHIGEGIWHRDTTINPGASNLGDRVDDGGGSN